MKRTRYDHVAGLRQLLGGWNKRKKKKGRDTGRVFSDTLVREPHFPQAANPESISIRNFIMEITLRDGLGKVSNVLFSQKGPLATK